MLEIDFKDIFALIATHGYDNFSAQLQQDKGSALHVH